MVGIGVDIGGTNVRAAIVDETGSVLDEVRLSTLANQGVDIVLEQIQDAIFQVYDKAQSSAIRISGIGIGCPGLVDPQRGIVRVPPNFPGWDEVLLGETIQHAFGLRTIVVNDVNAMALGELHYGAGQGFRDLICLTLGTGVGGAFLVGGKLHTGFMGTAGEIGHITVEPDGPQCNCGNRGCLERLIGSQAIVQRTVSKLKDTNNRSSLSGLDSSTLTPKIISDAGQRGDVMAKEVLREVGTYLGIVLAGLVNFLNPQAILIGGGVANAGDLIFEPVKKTIQRRAYSLPAEAVQILPAQLGDEAGVIGAATLVFLKNH